MKINNSTVNNGIRNARNEAQEKKAGSAAGSEKSRAQGVDRVELSVSLQEVDKLADTLAAMPGTNAEKVESIKSRIADGTYSVSGYEVAEKMLRFMGILKSEGE